MLVVTDKLPDEFFDVDSITLPEVLGLTSTLVHLEGEIKEPVFISVLQHGNESSGLIAVQNFLEKYKNKKLPRSISIFFGNMEAAQLGVRRLDTQEDYNRIWEGGEGPLFDMAQNVIGIMKHKNVFAVIDIHNNTGDNPPFACVNTLSKEHLNLAKAFAPDVVYFKEPKGSCAAGFSEICPSVTLECKRPNDIEGVIIAERFIEEVVNWKEVPKQDFDGDVLFIVAKAVIEEKAVVSIGEKKRSHIYISEDFDAPNFKNLEVGDHFFSYRKDGNPGGWVKVIGDGGHNVTDEYLIFENGRALFKQKITPCMLSKNLKVIKQDCLGYFMSRRKLNITE